ncbi:MAG TPA: hypothetical protein VEC96_02610, partial [Anaerolineae bacterium]|nr:hypothetical protein [Anaerolineae bacterium]
MNGLILIDPKQIKIFDSHRFTLLCNELLRTEAERLSIPQYLVDTTVSDTVPDGGIDCRVNRQDQGMDDSDRWIPQKTSAWQLKSGNC